MSETKGFTFIELLVLITISLVFCAIWLGFFGRGVGIYEYLTSIDVSGQIESISPSIPVVAITEAQSDVPVFPARVVIKQSDGARIDFLLDDDRFEQFNKIKAMGKCVIVRIYRYPPWTIFNGGTYHGGRLYTPSDCH